MDRCQVAFENVSPVEALFRGRTRARAESANHVAFVMCQCVAVLVVFSGKSFDMIRTTRDGTFFGPLGLMSKHVGF